MKRRRGSFGKWVFSYDFTFLIDVQTPCSTLAHLSLCKKTKTPGDTLGQTPPPPTPNPPKNLKSVKSRGVFYEWEGRNKRKKIIDVHGFRFSSFIQYPGRSRFRGIPMLGEEQMTKTGNSREKDG